jgi:ABC-type transporter Mla subunit MlaD
MLLEGVKTAFWASLAGVAGALYLRLLHYIRKTPATSNPEQVKSASLDDVVATMVALRIGLVGDEQGTLLSQIKLQRQESKDKLDELVSEFKNFASHMVENNQKAIVEALRQVIADFNEKLTEQFGENFKQLNAAVEKLVTWQEHYKDSLERIKEAQAQTAQDMQSAVSSLREFIGQAQNFSEISHSLREQLQLMREHQGTLFDQEKALAETLITMKDVVPQFAERVQSMLREIAEGVRSVENEVASLVKNLGVQLQSANADLKNMLSENMKESQREVGESLKSQVAVLKEGVLALDKALQTELNSALESLGRQLASLSNKFVDDYSPLTDRLREVVQLASRV